MAATNADGVAEGQISCATAQTDTVTAQILTSEGPYTLAQTVDITFVDANSSSFVVQVSPSPIGLGAAATVTITALNAEQAVDTHYTGTVAVGATDTQAKLPAPYTFKLSDAGVATLNGLAFKTAGDVTVMVRDINNTALRGNANVNVTQAASVNLTVSATPAHGVAGTALQVSARATDQSGHVLPNFDFTIQMTSTDSRAILPATQNVTSDGNGFMTLASPQLFTAGNQIITITDTRSHATARGSVWIVPGAASAAVLAGPASVEAGSDATVTVRLIDATGNIATGYRGTVQLFSSDSQIATHAYTLADSGVHAFSGLTFKQAGSVTLQAIDADNTDIEGTLELPVTAGTASKLVVTVQDSNAVVAGKVTTILVNAVDGYGNTDSSYNATLPVQSTDAQFKSDSSVAVVAGTTTFIGTFITAGGQTVTVGTAPMKGVSATTLVAPAAPFNYDVKCVASSPAGVSVVVALTVRDAFSNVATNYATTATVRTTDPKVEAQNVQVVAGLGNVAFVFQTAGAQSVVASSDSITGQAALSITAGAAYSLALTGIPVAPAPVPVGSNPNVVVNALDKYGNTATSYVGTVQFKSTDSKAQLPANYTFTAQNAGSVIFTGQLQFATVGTQSVTVSDPAASYLTSTISSIDVVTPTQLALGGLADHACARFNSGQVACWGDNGARQLGFTDAQAHRTALSHVNTATFINAVAVGPTFTCAVGVDGNAMCWGEGAVVDAGASVHFANALTQIAAGAQHVCAVDTARSVHCWGDNSSGALGLGDTASVSDRDPNTLPALQIGAEVSLVAAGDGSTCVLTANHEIMCWGSNALGQLGIAAAGPVSRPTARVELPTAHAPTAVAAGPYNYCILDDMGEVSCWGRGIGAQATAVDLGAHHTAVAIAVGTTQACAILDTKQVQCWGLGSVSSVTSDIAAGALPSGRYAVSLAMGSTSGGADYGCAIMDDGHVACWGAAATGQLSYY